MTSLPMPVSPKTTKKKKTKTKTKTKAELKMTIKPLVSEAKEKKEVKTTPTTEPEDEDEDTGGLHEFAKDDAEYMAQETHWKAQYDKFRVVELLNQPSCVRSKGAKLPTPDKKLVACVIHNASPEYQSKLFDEFHQRPGKTPFETFCNEEAARRQLFACPQYRSLEKHFLLFQKEDVIINLVTLLSDFAQLNMKYIEDAAPQQVQLHSWLIYNTQIYLLVYLSENGRTIKYRYAFCKCPCHV